MWLFLELTLIKKDLGAAVFFFFFCLFGSLYIGHHLDNSWLFFFPNSCPLAQNPELLFKLGCLRKHFVNVMWLVGICCSEAKLECLTRREGVCGNHERYLKELSELCPAYSVSSMQLYQFNENM